MINARTIIDFFCAALCSAIAIFINSNYGFVGIKSIIYPTAIATSIFIVLIFLLNYLERTELIRYVIRKYADERFCYEGNWLESYTKDNNIYHSYFSIKYSVKTENYTIEGISLNENGKIHSIWKSIVILFDINNHVIKFIYKSNMSPTVKISDKSRISSDNDAFEKSENDIFGLSSLTFSNAGDLKYSYGTGYFVDDTPPQRGNFKIKKVENSYIQEFIHKNSIDTEEDMANFIINYHKKYAREEVIIPHA